MTRVSILIGFFCFLTLTFCDVPQGPPRPSSSFRGRPSLHLSHHNHFHVQQRHKRDSTSTSDDETYDKHLVSSVSNSTGTSSNEKRSSQQIEARMGRVAPSSSVQSHRSNVKYSAGNRPQGPPTDKGPRPPAPPHTDGPFPPSPPLEVNDIRCLKMTTRERFSASISFPEGLNSAPPIFEDRPTVDPRTSRVCQISSADQSGSYKLEVSNLDACGVTTCSQDGQPWLCLTLRFPVLPGLKLPEDEIVVIRCKPQDRTIAEKKDIDFNGSEVEQRSPVTFSGGKQEFLCEIGLFRRIPGTPLFSQRLEPGTAVELGEEVQLRSIVRSNDGWFYSKLTDVVVRRLKSKPTSNGDGSAALVFSDGCRNPAFKTIAPQHPQRDARSSLLSNFNFRVFLFQDMEDGDTILISARVIACVEAIDCAPALCSDDRGMGYGKRRKRSSFNNENDFSGNGKTREILIEEIMYSNGSMASKHGSNLKGWETDLALRVAMPGMLPTAMVTLESNCFLYLMLTVAMATALGVSIILVSVYCICTCRRRNSKKNCSTPSSVATVTGSQPTSLETLVEACYPELQALDAISRSVRQKKQLVHEEILKLYDNGNNGPCLNHYTREPNHVPSKTKSGTVKQIKQMKQKNQTMNNEKRNVSTVTVSPTRNGEGIYWEIGQPQQTVPPTPV